MGLAGDEPHAVAHHLDLRRARLLQDLAEDLVQQVAERDEPRHGAELIHHHREADAGALHFAQHFARGLALGHEERRLHELADRRVGIIRLAEQILEAQHADDLVQAALEDRHAASPALLEGRPGRVQRGLDGNRVHGRARRHHLAHHRVAQGDDIADQFPVLGFKDAFGFALLEQGGDGFVRGLLILFAFVVGLVAARHRAGDGVHQGRQQALGGIKEREEAVQPSRRVRRDDEGRNDEVEEIEVERGDGAEDPEAARERVRQGPGREEEQRQEQHGPEAQRHAEHPRLGEELGEARVLEGLLFQQHAPLQRGQRIVGRQQDGHERAVGREEDEGRAHPEGNDAATARVGHRERVSGAGRQASGRVLRALPDQGVKARREARHLKPDAPARQRARICSRIFAFAVSFSLIPRTAASAKYSSGLRQRPSGVGGRPFRSRALLRKT